MFKQHLRWIIPFVALVLISTYLLLAPVLSTHATAPTTYFHTTVTVTQQHQGPTPNMFRRSH